MIPVILVCDDDADDQTIIKDAFAPARISANFQFTSDGQELVQYMENSNRDGQRPRPDIILVDLNMPEMNGMQALDWIKSHPDFRAIPVVKADSGFPVARDAI